MDFRDRTLATPRKLSEVVRKSIGWLLLVGQGGNQNSYEVRSQDPQAGIPLYAAVMPGRCLHRAHMYRAERPSSQQDCCVRNAMWA